MFVVILLLFNSAAADYRWHLLLCGAKHLNAINRKTYTHTHTHSTWWKPQKCHSNSLNFSVKQFSDCELLPNIRPSTFNNHGANQHKTVFDWIMSCFCCSWSCSQTLKSLLHYFHLFCTPFVSHNIVAKKIILPISKSYKAIPIPQICKSNMNCEYEICR